MSQFALELAELVDLFCEGDIAPEQAARLEALVAESDEARQYLLDCVQVHCELAWELGRENEDLEQADSLETAPALYCSEPKRKQHRVWMFAATTAALLVTLTLGLTTVSRIRGHKAESNPSSVAHIGPVKDVHWDGAAPAIDAPLPAGSKLAFQQGLLEVAFDSGASVILQGPADVELKSNSAILLRGSLTADVPAEARGFAVQTPNSTVVDLGTRFEVDCQAGQTYVEVFVGRVRLQLDDTQAGGSPQVLPLAAKKAVRVHGVPGHGALRIEQLTAGSLHFTSP
ncbi:MAG: FecR family protein [Thermoguttaceae bacterium]